MRRQRLSAWLRVMVIAGLLAGCWDYQDIENRVLGLGMGFFEGPEGRMDVLMEIPSLQQKGKMASVILQKRVKSLKDMAMEFDRGFDVYRPDFSHFQVLVFDEDLARNRGITDIIEFMLRAGHIPTGTRLVISAAPEQVYFRAFSEQRKPLRSVEIASVIDKADTTFPLVRRYRVGEYVGPSQHHEPVLLPVVDYVQGRFAPVAAALMRDGREIARLNGAQWMGVNCLRNPGFKPFVEGKIRSDQGEYLVNVLSHSAKITVTGPAQHPIVNVNVRLKAALMQSKMDTGQVTGLLPMHEVEADVAGQVRRQIETSLEFLRQHNADILHFKNLVRRRRLFFADPAAEVFDLSRAIFRVDVHAVVQEKDMIRKGL